MPKYIPEVNGELRGSMLQRVPEEIYACSGISIFGKRIKSIVFTTDVAMIRNNNADAVIAVYPFTPQPLITRAIMLAADVPVFCGVGGGLTRGSRVVTLAMEAEQQGAAAVVVNAPTPNSTIREIKKHLDIPIIITVAHRDDDYASRIEAGVSIFNVAASVDTAYIVSEIRRQFPMFPIIATGGPNTQTIQDTIAAGANAITWTPPSQGEIFADVMKAYRENKPHP